MTVSGRRRRRRAGSGCRSHHPPGRATARCRRSRGPDVRASCISPVGVSGISHSGHTAARGRARWARREPYVAAIASWASNSVMNVSNQFFGYQGCSSKKLSSSDAGRGSPLDASPSASRARPPPSCSPIAVPCAQSPRGRFHVGVPEPTRENSVTVSSFETLIVERMKSRSACTSSARLHGGGGRVRPRAVVLHDVDDESRIALVGDALGLSRAHEDLEVDPAATLFMASASGISASRNAWYATTESGSSGTSNIGSLPSTSTSTAEPRSAGSGEELLDRIHRIRELQLPGEGSVAPAGFAPLAAPSMTTNAHNTAAIVRFHVLRVIHVLHVLESGLVSA